MLCAWVNARTVPPSNPEVADSAPSDRGAGAYPQQLQNERKYKWARVQHPTMSYRSRIGLVDDMTVLHIYLWVRVSS